MSHKISDSGPSIKPFQLDKNQLPEEASFASKLDSIYRWRENGFAANRFDKILEIPPTHTG